MKITKNNLLCLLFSRIKYLAINGHGRHTVLMDYYTNGGNYQGEQVEPGLELFLTANVLLLDDKVTYNERMHVVLLTFENEENGTKLAKCWDFMSLFGKQLKALSYAEIEAQYKHVNPSRYAKSRISEFRGAYNAYSAIPGGLEALRHYTQFVENDHGLQGIMGLNCLNNNKELEICVPEVKQQVLEVIRETCTEDNFALANTKYKWTPAALTNWRILNSGPAYTELIFRLRTRALCKAAVSEALLNGDYNQVSPSSYRHIPVHFLTFAAIPFF